MKVLHVITSLSVGGAEKLLLDTIPFYFKKGINVDLLLLNSSDSMFLRKLKELNICNIYSLGKGSVYNPLFIFKIIPFLKKYNWVHVHLFPTLYWVAIAKIVSRNHCKLVYTEHNTYNKRRNKKWLQPIEKQIYKQYSKIICISDKTKEFLCSWLDLSQEDNRLTVIHNGIDLSRFETANAMDKENLGISENGRILLMTARFNIQKDPNTLIKAFHLLKSDNLYLIFIGDGILRKESEELVRQLKLQDKVLFLGIREDIPELIKMAYICVLSSNWEGFGLVAAEYMAAGKPAVVSDVDGLRDVVRNAGILFEKGNVNDLKEKLDMLLNNDTEYQKVCKACLIKSKEFSLEKMVDSYINVY
jgi:glycosyltransferase involved in cell wall biosynthesis